MNDADVIVIGAGAAGLWAGAATAAAGLKTLIVEKTERTGTKILASGGSRCNLTTTLDKRRAAQLFGPDGARFLGPAFSALSPQEVRARFLALGVPTKTEDALQKVFPKSDSAKQVRDVLERSARRSGAEILLNTPVLGLESRPGQWRVQTKKKVLTARSVVLCSGGKSFPKTGTTGDGYKWLRDLGLKVVDPVPALVPLVSPLPWVRALTGIAVDAEAKIAKNKRRRPVLFTHQGLSGPGAMDLSVHVARAQGPVTLHLDLLPDQSREELSKSIIDAAASRGNLSVSKLVGLQRRLFAAVCEVAGVQENPRVCELSKKQRNKLIDALKGLPITITGTTGFQKAEVTAGGLSLTAVDRKTMAVHSCPGLFVCGEMLDLSGPIGGLNFQAAFATAELGAKGVIAYLSAES